MKSHPSNYLGWLLVVGIVAIASVTIAIRRLQPPQSLAVGKPAPPLEVVPLVGDAPPISPAGSPGASAPTPASFKGLTLIHFWGTWCPPCRMEYPDLVDMVAQFSGNPHFRFVSVSCEPSIGEGSLETLRQQTREYYESLGIQIPTYYDPAGITRRATAERMEHPGIYYPSTLLIDDRGTIAAAWEGFTPSSVSQMRKAIASRLKTR